MANKGIFPILTSCNCNISTGVHSVITLEPCLHTNKHIYTKIHTYYINKSLYNFLNDDKWVASVTTAGIKETPLTKVGINYKHMRFTLRVT